MLPQRVKRAITENPKKLANLIDLANLPSTLREFVGQSQISRLGCFMRVWSYIKTNNLQVFHLSFHVFIIDNEEEFCLPYCLFTGMCSYTNIIFDVHIIFASFFLSLGTSSMSLWSLYCIWSENDSYYNCCFLPLKYLSSLFCWLYMIFFTKNILNLMEVMLFPIKDIFRGPINWNEVGSS